MKIRLTGVMVILTGILIAGCSTSEEKVAKAKDEAEAANEAYIEEMENYKAEKWEIIKSNELVIAKMKKDASSGDAVVNAEYEAMIADLDARNEAMKLKLKNYEDEGESGWKKFKTEFSHDMDELGAAFSGLFKDEAK